MEMAVGSAPREVRFIVKFLSFIRNPAEVPTAPAKISDEKVNQ
jgi:hypothetical protein